VQTNLPQSRSCASTSACGVEHGKDEKIDTFRAAKTLSYVRVLQIEEPFRELKAYSSDDLFAEYAKNSTSLPTRQTAGEKKPHECGFFLIS
jgi:hypothetical protein